MRTRTAKPSDTQVRSALVRYHAGEFLIDLARELKCPSVWLSRHFRKLGAAPLSKQESTRRVNARKEAGRAIASNLSVIIERYRAGETLSVLAPIAGYKTWQALRKKLAECGVEINSYPRQQRNIDTADLVGQYERGTPISGLMEASGLSRNAVRNRLVNAGVTLRCESIAREQQLTFATPVESDLVAELHQWDIRCTPQKAVGSKNIDVALDDVKIAIEIENGPTFAPSFRNRMIARTRFLLDEGWCVLFVVIQRYITNWFDVIECIRSLAERALINGDVFGHYGAINHRGQVRTTPRFTLADLPRIPGL